MSAPNPFFELQDRLAELLAAAPYFQADEEAEPPRVALVPGETLLTERIADLDTRIATSLLNLGFGVVVTTAKGDSSPPQRPAKTLDSVERLTIAIVHNPLLDTPESAAEPARNALAGLFAAIAAVHGQPLVGDADPRGQDTFQVTGHENRSEDAPEGVVVQQAFVSIRSRLL